MRSSIWLLTTFLALLPSSAEAAINFAAKGDAAERTLSAPSQEFPVGEKLIYDIAWLGVPVATGVVETYGKTTLEGRDVYPVKAVIQTNGVLATLFPMHDTIESWIDAETLEAVRFERDIREKSRRFHDRTTFTRPKGTLESFLTGEKKEIELGPAVHDVLSVFYWARRQPLEPGKSYRTVLNVEGENWEVEIAPLRREILEPRGQGVVDTIVVEPRSKVRGIVKRGKSWAHIQNSPSRTPVRVSYKAPFGTVIGSLRKE